MTDNGASVFILWLIAIAVGLWIQFLIIKYGVKAGLEAHRQDMMKRQGLDLTAKPFI